MDDYLQHILQAIARVQRYTAGLSAAGFSVDEKTQDAVLRNIEVMGEAARNVQRHHPDFASAQADIPCGLMVSMRIRLSHGYFAVDTDLVWATVQDDLPILHAQVLALTGVRGEPAR